MPGLASAWVGDYEYRICATGTNPAGTSVYNETTVFSMNPIALIGLADFSNFTWGDEDIELGWWCYNDNCTASGNTTMLVMGDVLTSNASIKCIYGNSTLGDDDNESDITEAGVFGDNWNDANIDDWGGGYPFDGVTTKCAVNAAGYVESVADNRGIMQNVTMNDMDGFRVYARSYTTNNGIYYYLSQYDGGDLEDGYLFVDAHDADSHVQMYMHNSSGYDKYGEGDVSWAATTWYNTMFERKLSDGSFEEYYSTADFPTTQVTLNDIDIADYPPAYTDLEVVGLNVRSTGARSDFILVTRRCDTCTWTWGALEARPPEPITIYTPTEGQSLTVRELSVSWGNNTANISSAWYNLNGSTNYTVSGNFSLQFNESANHVLAVYYNDTGGAVYGEDVSFTTSYAVTVDVTDPANGSYQSYPDLDLTWNYVSLLACNASSYSIDDGTNVTTSCANVTAIDITGLAGGYHNITMYANSSEGRGGSDFVEFHIVSPIVNCTDPGASYSVNFTFMTETGLAALDGSADYAVTIDDGTYNFTYNLSVENVKYFELCTQDPPWRADMIMEYSAPSYSTRFYFFDNASLTASTSDITLYLLNSSLGSTVDVDVQNPYGYALTDHYVRFQKYYISENLYRTVAMLKSDDQGDGQAFLDITDAWYKYVVTQGGVVIRTIGPSLLSDTSLIVSTATGTTYTQADYSDGIASSCDYDEATEHVICTADDPSGLSSQLCLRVDEFNVLNMTLFNLTCEASTSVTLMVNVSEAGAFNNTVRYILYAVTSSGDKILEMAHVPLGVTVLFGVMGVLMTVIIYMVAAGAGYWNPSVSLALGALGIAMSVIIGFMVIEMVALGSLLLVFGIFMYKVRT